MNRIEKIYAYTIAGCCGVVGFILSYITLSWVLEPINEWIELKFQ